MWGVCRPVAARPRPKLINIRLWSEAGTPRQPEQAGPVSPPEAAAATPAENGARRSRHSSYLLSAYRADVTHCLTNKESRTLTVLQTCV